MKGDRALILTYLDSPMAEVLHEKPPKIDPIMIATLTFEGL